MKNTTNKIQRNYMAAKALVKTLEAREKEIEQEYIKRNCITNPDGTTPECVYCIEDEETFDRANKETAKIVEDSGLWAEMLEARELEKQAGNELIKYGLSLAPAHIADTLNRAAKTNYTTRLKIIDLAMKLDVSTVMA